ncbi:MAG: ankyrin repeat domain-containing protein [Spirochaetales bacterium]|nr:ankyrin repeat domain-containing protein [Spirochaetales bacterium]
MGISKVWRKHWAKTASLVVTLGITGTAWGLPEVSWSVMNNDPPDFIVAYKAQPAGTPLPVIEAVRYGSQDVLSTLLAQGGDPNARDSNGTPALFWAAREGRIDLVNMLLKAGALSRATDALGSSWVSAAAQAPHLALLKLALQSTPQFAQTANILGDTPLLSAAQAGRLDAVRLLLTAGADPKVTDYLGRTLLTMAQTSGNDSLVSFVQSLEVPRKGGPNGTAPPLLQEQTPPASPATGNALPRPLIEHPTTPGAVAPVPSQSVGQKKAS